MIGKIFKKLFPPKTSKLSRIMDSFKNKHKSDDPIGHDGLKKLESLVLKDLKEGSSEVYIAIADKREEELRHSIERGVLGIISAGLHDGEKTLWVFSSVHSLRHAYSPHNKDKCRYVKISGDKLYALASENGFRKVIIDNLCPLVLSELPQGMDSVKIPKNTEITVGLPTNPIPENILKKIIRNFSKNNKVMELYHYLQFDFTHKLMIGIVLKQGLTSEEENEINKMIMDIIEGSQFNIYLNYLNTEGGYYQLLSQLDEALIFKRDNGVKP